MFKWTKEYQLTQHNLVSHGTGLLVDCMDLPFNLWLHLELLFTIVALSVVNGKKKKKKERQRIFEISECV